MGFFERAKEAAKNAVDSVSQVANDTGKVVSKSISEGSAFVSEKVSSSVDTISSVSRSAYDSMCDAAVQKIKSMLRGVDLQSAINALNKHHDETGTDVSALVNFINQIKSFSEDGGQ